MVELTYTSKSGDKIYLVKEQGSHYMYWGKGEDLSKLSRQELTTPAGNKPRNVNKYFLQAAKALEQVTFQKI
jgi:uncharacterized protein YcgL (UPF0745 family)